MSIQQLKTPQDIKKLGTILSFWAHPDDETFSCAGIMAAAIQNGQRVICVTATRGEEGVQDENRWPPEQLPEIRTQELYAALKILGITEHYFLTYRDGSCADVPIIEGENKVLEFIREYNPDTILTFGPEGLTGHTDHKSVSKWVNAAVKRLEHPPHVYHLVELKERYDRFMKRADEQFDIYFNIDKPPLKKKSECELCFMCPPGICDLKCDALRAMPSQTDSIMNGYDKDTLREMFRPESFIRSR